MTDQANNQKPADSPEANYDGQRTVVLPGGLPPLKEVEAKKPAVRQPMALTNAQDVAAIHRNQTWSRQIDSLAQRLRQMLIQNLEFVPHASKLIRELGEAITEANTSDEEQT